MRKDTIAALHRHRSLSVRDRRMDDAKERLDSAKQAAERLHKAPKDKAASQVEVDALKAEWEPFEKLMEGAGQELDSVCVQTATAHRCQLAESSRPAPAGFRCDPATERHARVVVSMRTYDLCTLRATENLLDRGPSRCAAGSSELHRRWMSGCIWSPASR